MKSKKYMLMLCIMALCFVFTTGCQEQESKRAENTVTTEDVTEFHEEQMELSFSDIENGINFKASGASIVLKFEDISDFDNTLKMEFSLVDASYENDPMVIPVSEEKSEYRFEKLEKGSEYYLEVYPTESAESDNDYKEIQKKNKNCPLQLIQ